MRHYFYYLLVISLVVLVPGYFSMRVSFAENSDISPGEIRQLLEQNKREPRDYSKVIGPDGCAVCHRSEYQVWESTRHSTTYDTLATSNPRSKKIMAKLGLRGTPRRASRCTDCHITRWEYKGREKSIAGVSCEMCHNPGSKWVTIHNNYGKEDDTRASETPEHRSERHRKSQEEGMIRPANLYKLAEGCYQCHIIDDEELINKGGHPLAQPLELVSWTQGKMRHNFTMSEDGNNRESPIERKRVMYITGLMLDLEYSLRAFAKVTKPGKQHSFLYRKLTNTIAQLSKVLKKTSLPEISLLFRELRGVKLDIGNSEILNKAADKTAWVAITFSQKHDGSKLTAVDTFLQK